MPGFSSKVSCAILSQLIVLTLVAASSHAQEMYAEEYEMPGETPEYYEPEYYEPEYYEGAELGYEEPAYMEPVYVEPVYEEATEFDYYSQEAEYAEPEPNYAAYSEPTPEPTPESTPDATPEPSYSETGYSEPSYSEPSYSEPSYSEPSYDSEYDSSEEYSYDPSPESSPAPSYSSTSDSGTSASDSTDSNGDSNGDSNEEPATGYVESTPSSPPCDLEYHLYMPAFTSPPSNFEYARHYHGDSPSYADGVATARLEYHKDLQEDFYYDEYEVGHGSVSGYWGKQVSGSCEQVSYANPDGAQIAGQESVSYIQEGLRRNRDGEVIGDWITDRERVATGYIDPEGGGSMPLETVLKFKHNSFTHDAENWGQHSFNDKWSRRYEKTVYNYEGSLEFVKSLNKTELEFANYAEQKPDAPLRIINQHINVKTTNVDECASRVEEEYRFSLRNLDPEQLKDISLTPAGKDDAILDTVRATGAQLSGYEQNVRFGYRQGATCKTTYELKYVYRPIQGAEYKTERIWNVAAQAYDEHQWYKAGPNVEWKLVSSTENETPELY